MDNFGRIWLILGSLFGAAAVTLGAFHAHGLKEFLETRFPGEASPAVVAASGAASTDGNTQKSPLEKRLANFDTATRYTMYHALALLALGLLTRGRKSMSATLAGTAFALGVALFSGLLYAMVFGGPKILGAIVPIGGLLLIAGWVLMALAALRAR
jgi:uncharacterized membrane protein YgdD (TMEM256/DUF423 family)